MTKLLVKRGDIRWKENNVRIIKVVENDGKAKASFPRCKL